ncbi:MAG: MFS transporter [Pseudonocardiaceae bacterium]
MTLSSGALRADPGFRRYLAARVITTAGTLVTAVVLPVLVYRLTWSAAWTAAVVVAEALPHLLLARVVARIAVRLKHGALLFAADLAGAALLTSIPLAWWNGHMSAWHVLAVACAMQVVFLLLAAAHTSALHALVGPELTTAGGSALRGATGLVELMVPPLAGLAVAIVAPAPLLVLDAVSFLVSALLVRGAIRGRPGAPALPKPRQVRTGLRFLRGNRPSRTLVVAGTLHAAAGAAYLAMLLPWADRQLGVPPSGDARLALLVSCWGLGVIVGRSAAPLLIRRIGPVRLARRALVVALAGGLGVLVCTNWLLAALAGLLWGAAYIVAVRATMDALGQPARPVARLLWRSVGPVTGAALAGALAVWSTPRAGLAAGVTLLAVATLTVRRTAVAVPPDSVPTQGARTRDCGPDCAGDCSGTQHPSSP